MTHTDLEVQNDSLKTHRACSYFTSRYQPTPVCGPPYLRELPNPRPVSLRYIRNIRSLSPRYRFTTREQRFAQYGALARSQNADHVKLAFAISKPKSRSDLRTVAGGTARW